MKTLIFKGVHGGDWVRCCDCGAQMLLPHGADRCPVCSGDGCLQWVNENEKEVEDEFQLPEIECTGKELQPQDYLEVETLEQEYPNLYKELMGRSIQHSDFHYAYKYLHKLEHDELLEAVKAHGGYYEFGKQCLEDGEVVDTEYPLIAISSLRFIPAMFDVEVHKVMFDKFGELAFEGEEKEIGFHVDFRWDEVELGHLSYLTADIPPVNGKYSVSKDRQIVITVKNGKVNIEDNVQG